jgi:DnaJ domain
MPSPVDRTLPTELWAALIDFHESPGRHAMARGEPKALFARVREVMGLAADRAVSTSVGAAPPHEVGLAARFFVRTVMFRSGGTHYDVLGLTRGEDLSALREHYRLLIRMTHPDFSGDGEKWPDDAAARVNLAYDILSSPVKRAEYDAQLNAPGNAASAPKKAPVRSPRRQVGPAGASRRRLGAYLSGALAAGALSALAMLWPSAGDDSLGTTSETAGRLLNLSESPDAFAGGAGTAEEAGRAAIPRTVVAQVPQALRGASGQALQTVVPVPRRAGPPLEQSATPVASAVARVGPSAMSEKAGAVETLAIAASPAADPAPAPTVREAAPDPKPETASTGGDIRTYQPVLADLLHMLETGQPDRLQRWAARATQQDGVAERFADAYRQLMGDAVVTGLGQVRFDLKHGQERPVVQGLVQLRVLDRNQQASVRDFRLRAQFVSRANGPQLAAIDAE